MLIRLCKRSPQRVLTRPNSAPAGCPTALPPDRTCPPGSAPCHNSGNLGTALVTQSPTQGARRRCSPGEVERQLGAPQRRRPAADARLVQHQPPAVRLRRVHDAPHGAEDGLWRRPPRLVQAVVPASHAGSWSFRFTTAGSLIHCMFSRQADPSKRVWAGVRLPHAMKYEQDSRRTSRGCAGQTQWICPAPPPAECPRTPPAPYGGMQRSAPADADDVPQR